MLRKKDGKTDKKQEKAPQPTAGVAVKPVVAVAKPIVAVKVKEPQVAEPSKPQQPRLKLTDEELKVYQDVKKLVGGKYDQATIIEKVKDLKSVEAVFKSMSSEKADKLLATDNLAFEKLSISKPQDKQFINAVGSYKSRMASLKAQSTPSELSFSIKQLADCSKYAANFTADAYV